jgi:hypothetical protein
MTIAPPATRDRSGSDQTPSEITSPSETLDAMTRRLSRLSIERHFEAYVDIAWDDPEMAVDPTDRRWIIPDDEGLANTAWYRSQPPEVQARIGLHRVASSMRTGWQFENILQRGLLTVAYRLPNDRPEFRYIHHEVIEESQHSLMFQELVNRSGLPVTGLPKLLEFAGERIVLPTAWWFPELFFFFVLGGEDPIDNAQRRRLRAGIDHPLLERIVKIHVTEEARHLSFARHYLRTKVPNVGFFRRRLIALSAPVLLGVMAHAMLVPGRRFARECDVPRKVVREAARSDAARAEMRASVAKVRKLCADLKLIDPVSRLLWRAFGIWDDDRAGKPGGSVVGPAAESPPAEPAGAAEPAEAPVSAVAQ